MKKIPKRDYTPEFKERPPKRWIRHSDRGSQYSRDCQKLLQQFGMVVSMPQREATHYAVSRMWFAGITGFQ